MTILNNNNANTLLCTVTVEWRRNNNGIRYMGYRKCGCPVKYSITFKKSTTGEMTTENVCGRHNLLAKKSAERLKKHYQFDSLFVSTEL